MENLGQGLMHRVFLRYLGSLQYLIRILAAAPVYISQTLCLYQHHNLTHLSTAMQLDCHPQHHVKTSSTFTSSQLRPRSPGVSLSLQLVEHSRYRYPPLSYPWEDSRRKCLPLSCPLEEHSRCRCPVDIIESRVRQDSSGFAYLLRSRRCFSSLHGFGAWYWCSQC